MTYPPLVDNSLSRNNCYFLFSHYALDAAMNERHIIKNLELRWLIHKKSVHVQKRHVKRYLKLNNP